MAMDTQLKGHLGLVSEQSIIVRAVRVMTTGTGKSLPLPLRVFLSAYRMACRSESPNDMKAAPDSIPSVTGCAYPSHGLNGQGCIFRGMGGMTGQANSTCHRRMDILFRKGCLIMTVVTEVRWF